MDIDQAYAEFEAKEAELSKALACCEAEQEAGRTGFEAWKRADQLQTELQIIVQRNLAMIGEAIEQLGQAEN
ncbi:MAG: hypothetical protein ABGW87_07630 [Sphingomonadaceae bacterium]